jgi:hypothetical protein
MAGPSMKSPSSSTTEFRDLGQPLSASWDQFAFKSGQRPLSTPPASKKMVPQVMCADPPIVPTTTVSHRGGSCLRFPTNRQQNILDRINDRCETITLKKRFLITSPIYYWT